MKLLHSSFGRKSIGMIGMGFISSVHIEAVQSRKNFFIKALSDANQAVLEQKGKMLGVKELYPDYRFMLQNDSIDIIDIMTPNYLHKPCACEALQTGKTVICEKPIATSIEDVDDMIFASKKAKRHIYLKQYLRYSLAYQKAKKLLDQNVIGLPYYVQCTFTGGGYMNYYNNPFTWVANKHEAGGGIFIDVGVHILDLLQWFFGLPHAAYGQSKNITGKLDQKGEDTVSALIEYDHNIMANVYCTQIDKGYGFRWEVRLFGLNGIIMIADNGKEEKIIQVIRDNTVIYEYIEKDWWHQSNIRAVQDILDRIAKDEDPAISIEDAKVGIDTVLAVYRASAGGKKIILK